MNKRKYDLEEICEAIHDDKTKEGEDTLMKYFFAEDTRISKIKQNKSIVSIEKIEKMFNKPIRLRNAVKQTYWDRHNIVRI